MNNKGFMMAEVVIVASIVLVTMAGLYASYNKIFSLYNQRIDYYDVSTLYELGQYKKNDLSTIKNMFIYNDVNNTIYYVSKDDIKQYKYDVSILSIDNQTFQDYFSFLSNSLELDDVKYQNVDNFLVMEKCINEDNCKYAYLEVFNDELSPE